MHEGRRRQFASHRLLLSTCEVLRTLQTKKQKSSLCLSRALQGAEISSLSRGVPQVRVRHKERDGLLYLHLHTCSHALIGLQGSLSSLLPRSRVGFSEATYLTRRTMYKKDEGRNEWTGRALAERLSVVLVIVKRVHVALHVSRPCVPLSSERCSFVLSSQTLFFFFLVFFSLFLSLFSRVVHDEVCRVWLGVLLGRPWLESLRRGRRWRRSSNPLELHYPEDLQSYERPLLRC